jgi:hypothetical protein
VLAALASDSDTQTYLGIGVQEGECVKSVVLAGQVKKLLLCDTWGPHHGGTNRGSHAHISEMLLRIGYNGNVQYFDMPSNQLVTALNEWVDLSYVDGDHSENTAFRDMTLAWIWSCHAMVVHDIYMPSVDAAMKRFLLTTNDVDQVVKFTNGTGTAVIYR